MEPVVGARRPARRKRWALAVVLCLSVLAVGVAVARPLWLRAARKDPARLDMLYAAWAEFNAKHYDGATALLNRRAREVRPTPLDWMLRARIAQSQGRLVQALEHLKHIPDSDPISAQAWLKAGQIELERNRAAAAEAAYRRSISIDQNQLQSYRELAYLYALQRRRAECDAEFRALDERVTLNYILAFAWCQNF